MNLTETIRTIDETWNDPLPGTDKAWETLSDSEKAIFRMPVQEMGKSFNDLFKDRAAIDVEFNTVVDKETPTASNI